jgi:hypothetical protein
MSVMDPGYQEKLAYIQQHHLVVYRLHDAIHADSEDDHILHGLREALGWTAYPDPSSAQAEHFVTIPPPRFQRSPARSSRTFRVFFPGVRVDHVLAAQPLRSPEHLEDQSRF